MKNVTRFLTAAFVIGVFCTMTFAQTDARPAGPIKGTVVKGGTNAPASNQKTSEAKTSIGAINICWSPDENTAASYRLKVWQLMQGQTAETAIASNKTIVTVSQHAINTKGAGANDRTLPAESDPDVIKVCSESLQAQEHAIKTKGMGGDRSSTETDIAAKPHAIKTKGVGGERAVTNPQTTLNPVQVFVVDNLPVCAEGASCDYGYTVEALNAQGNPVNPNIQPLIIKFGINWKTGRAYFSITY
jgi:hypothetical protein